MLFNDDFEKILQNVGSTDPNRHEFSVKIILIKCLLVDYGAH